MNATMTVAECPAHWSYSIGEDDCPACTDSAFTYHRWTAFCAFPDSPRGEYDEEIDVLTTTRSAGTARRIAEAAIDLHYQRDLRVRRVAKVW